MQAKPVRGRILVRRDEELSVTMGGIFVPDKARERLNEGEVLAIAEETMNEHGVIVPHICAVGDRIIFGKYAGLEVKIDGEEFVIMNETEVLVILPQKTEEQKEREKQLKAEQSILML